MHLYRRLVLADSILVSKTSGPGSNPGAPVINNNIFGRSSLIVRMLLFNFSKMGCSEVWLSRVPWEHEIAGSSPVAPVYYLHWYVPVPYPAFARRNQRSRPDGGMFAISVIRTFGREVEGDGLENRWSERTPGFESQSVRHASVV